MVPRRGRMGGRDVRKFGMHMYTLLHFKWITNKDLLYREQGTLLMLCGRLDVRGIWGRMDT